LNPAGRAVLKTADYTPPPEQPDDEYPYLLTTGRTAYHWHTRTKTGRVRQLNEAAPDVWIELCRPDAERLGVGEGDLVRVESPRGELVAPARISGVREGVVFAPFHYGSWDRDGDRRRAANELTITAWDPVSKQPLFKVAAVRLAKIADGAGPSPAPTTTASAPAS
jgi:anaerobic selenocysteine-containing dehydrogenase